MSVEIPSFSFADGQLSIESPFSQIRLRWKPSPLAEERYLNEHTWRLAQPEFRLIQPASSPTSSDASKDKNEAFTAFRAEIPPELPPHVERFASHQWALLAMLQENPKTIDLAVSNPVLAWSLANNGYFRGKSHGTTLLAVIHSHHKQRAIAEWLGFPGTEATVKLLRKIPPEAASPALVNGLRLVLTENGPLPEGSHHLKVLNAGVLALIGTPQLYPFLSPALLEEVTVSAEESEFPQTASRLSDILTIYRAAKTPCPMGPIRSIAKVEDLIHQAEEAYQAHLRRLAEAAAREKEAQRQLKAMRRAARQQRAVIQQQPFQPKFIKFPPPPVPGTDDISPLRTSIELDLESDEQVNCVRSYRYKILSGGFYLYRIRRPERATLSIVKRPDGSWRRQELKSYRNGPVSAETVRAVDHWLSLHRVSL